MKKEKAASMLADPAKPGQNTTKRVKKNSPEEKPASIIKTSAGQDEATAILKTFLEEDIPEQRDESISQQ
jgi:hypothetical protein